MVRSATRRNQKLAAKSAKATPTTSNPSPSNVVKREPRRWAARSPPLRSARPLSSDEWPELPRSSSTEEAPPASPIVSPPRGSGTPRQSTPKKSDHPQKLRTGVRVFQFDNIGAETRQAPPLPDRPPAVGESDDISLAETTSFDRQQDAEETVHLANDDETKLEAFTSGFLLKSDFDEFSSLSRYNDNVVKSDWFFRPVKNRSSPEGNWNFPANYNPKGSAFAKALGFAKHFYANKMASLDALEEEINSCKLGVTLETSRIMYIPRGDGGAPQTFTVSSRSLDGGSTLEERISLASSLQGQFLVPTVPQPTARQVELNSRQSTCERENFPETTTMPQNQQPSMPSTTVAPTGSATTTTTSFAAGAGGAGSSTAFPAAPTNIGVHMTDVSRTRVENENQPLIAGVGRGVGNPTAVSRSSTVCFATRAFWASCAFFAAGALIALSAYILYSTYNNCVPSALVNRRDELSVESRDAQIQTDGMGDNLDGFNEAIPSVGRIADDEEAQEHDEYRLRTGRRRRRGTRAVFVHPGLYGRGVEDSGVVMQNDYDAETSSFSASSKWYSGDLDTISSITDIINRRRAAVTRLFEDVDSSSSEEDSVYFIAGLFSEPELEGSGSEASDDLTTPTLPEKDPAIESLPVVYVAETDGSGSGDDSHPSAGDDLVVASVVPDSNNLEISSNTTTQANATIVSETDAAVTPGTDFNTTVGSNSSEAMEMTELN
ncbi:Oidioi.mRNA.OKI2018_I69.chr2.g6153.t1.cds [Oikopleura dioica]|uniref:Oidioi.mRNA.OKI2018_I69.chr2.g6153.t1.cds n=1 Tax=Oikopleura dioica TaxID=34765 RepID=A0ABN7T4C4_OIKDI|nr:Oidioi.mRNA.OKI2018_I69.chr2.g6153.t1.cds [Oikopleura dioica]